MRGKRAKQYRKLMKQYGLTFGFREPYQVLVDAQMIQDAERFKMELVGGLERTLSGKVKPMITQCSIRHLYALPSSDTVSPSVKESLIATAKTMERRRCNHHELDQPLSTIECLSGVIDPKGSGTNKNRYIVASQEEEVRRYCRGLKGVPLIYVKRSVMVMEPMSEGSVGVRESAEKEKFRQGLRGRVAGLGKRKRDDEGLGDGDGVKNGESASAVNGEAEVVQKKKKARGPKGPNPLSVRKSRKEIKAAVTEADTETEGVRKLETIDETRVGSGQIIDVVNGEEADGSHPSRRKRKRRRQKPQPNGVAASGEIGSAAGRTGFESEDVGEEASAELV